MRRRATCNLTPSDNLRTAGFTLVELVIVVVIVAVVAAIAIPRMSRASAGAGDSALATSARELRAAIERYHAEHGMYPTAAPLADNKTTVMFQLTQYTDFAGNYSPTRSPTYCFGPYLRVIPALAASSRRGRDRINTSDSGGAGWLYDPSTGDILPNTGAETDDKGRLYSSY